MIAYPPPPPRRRVWPAVVTTGATALLLGGVAGAVIGYANGHRASTAVTTLDPTVPAVPDPVCGEWDAQSRDYDAKTEQWAKSDPSVPASSWSPETRALYMAIIPVLQQEAGDMRRLADKAGEPFLGGLMRAQANYEEAFAARIPDYQASDDDLWQAVSSFNDAIGGVCQAVSRR